MKDPQVKMPVLFVGHGSPMNAIEDNEFSREWEAVAKSLPSPKAIVCISAHWQTDGTFVTAMEHPRTICDFYGFPKALYAKEYPAPGSSELAASLQKLLGSRVGANLDWGLDHGTWSVLCRMFPKADIPVVQLSLDQGQEPKWHYEFARKLGELRHQGVLIMGSGNVVHNLGRLSWDESAFDWALEFDERIKALILANDHQAIVKYKDLGPAARLAVPTNEHYLPLLYVLALQDKAESVRFFAEKVTLGAISMRSVRIG
ncbi:MAG: 4,5-DOPA dioxygenase extradiol [Candidatus Omnitrophica bacterium]|nr:4,5-DOPA dioxygenase extradiol [Candidatus Omnitrophota bacterium]